MQFDKYSKFSINNINEEHVEFILIISKLYDATIKRLPSDKIIMILDDLEDYTYAHFRVEEKLYCYSKPNIHIIKDNLLIEKLDDYRNKFESNQLTVDQLFNSIFNWFLAHLKNHEIEFNDFIAKEKLNTFYSENIEEHLEF